MTGLGSVVGRYEVQQQLGQGGMGQVYTGIDPALGRRVAIKVLHSSEGLRSDLVARLLNEARAAASIGHPGIVQIYDVGTTADGLPYIVMELLEGQTLGERLRNGGALPEPELVSVALQVTNALAAAHARGIIHRDLKPENIYLLESGLVKVLDFGIAKLDERPEGPSSLTQTGTLLGTPTYMSPEQARGNRNIDHRSDLYALGCVMFEMASGRAPFGGESTVEVLYSHMSASPPALESIAPGVRPELAQIVAKLLQKNPDDRYQSADETAAALRPLAPLVAPRATPYGWKIEGEPSSLPRPTPPVPVTLVHTAISGMSAPSAAPASPQPPAPAAPPPPLGWKQPAAAAPPPPSAPGPAPFGLPVDIFDARTRITNVQKLAGDSPIDRLAAGLPTSMRSDADLFWDFLSPAFDGVERLFPGLFSLSGVKLPDADANDYYLLFMEAGQTHEEGPDRGSRLDTTVFTSYAQPLEKRLKALPNDRRRVVVVITDSQKLGEGVREQIASFRRKHNAVVIPVYVLELANARRQRTLPNLFQDRLAYLHSPADPFASVAATTDVTRFFGMRATLNDLLAALNKRAGFFVLCGPPGGGKTSLLNMVNLELCRTFRFCRVRCAGHTTFSSFERALLEALRDGADSGPHATMSGASPGADTTAFATVLHRIAAQARAKGEQLVVALEDADWLVRLLHRPHVAEADRDAARAVWTTLKDSVEAQGLRVIVTGLRGFLLKEPTLAGWDNPLPSLTWVCQVPNLEFPAVARMARELGAEGDIRFSDEAVTELARQTAGHVDLVLRTCSYAVRKLRQGATGPAHLLSDAYVSGAHVKEAADDLVQMAATFSSTFMPLLSREERDVLRVVASVRPAAARTVRRRLGESWRPEETSEALESLRHMGVVERREGRERIAIPMLERWATRHLDDPTVRMVLDRRVRVAGVGLGATALLVAVYLAFIQSGTAVSRALVKGACQYSVQYPRRSAETAEAKLYWRRECPPGASDAASGLTLVPAMGTVVKFGTITGETRPERHCELAASGGCAATEVEIPVRLVESASSDFEIDIKDGGATRAAVLIARDPFAEIKGVFDGAFKLVAGLPAALGLLAAFFRDIQKALGRVFGVGTRVTPDVPAGRPRKQP